MLILSSTAKEWEVVYTAMANAGVGTTQTTIGVSGDTSGATLLVMTFGVSTAAVIPVSSADFHNNAWSPILGDDTSGGWPWVGIRFVSRPLVGIGHTAQIWWNTSDYGFAVPLNFMALRHPRNPQMVVGSVESITAASMANFSLPRNGIMIAAYGTYRGIAPSITSIDDPVGNTLVTSNPATSAFNANLSTFIYGPGKATGPLTVGNTNAVVPNTNATVITLVPA